MITLCVFNDFIIVYSHTDSLPKVYYYSPPSSRNNGVLVMELIGTNLGTLHEKFGPFSTVTVMRIGLQVVISIDDIILSHLLF